MPENAEQPLDLLQGGADAGEGRAQLSADTVDGSDDRDRDPGGDQPVFDRGGAGFVLQELNDKRLHGLTCPIFNRN